MITQEEFCNGFLSLAMSQPQLLGGAPDLASNCFTLLMVIQDDINKLVNDKIMALIGFMRGRGVPGW